MKSVIIIFFIFVTAGPVHGQDIKIKRDTSFTIYSAYTKEKKKRPYIEIATVERPPVILFSADIVYRKIGNRELLLDIFYPEKTHRLKPGILMIYGGGWRSGDKSQNHPMAIEMAKRGYVTVSAEYRLSPEALYPAAVLDLKAAISWMRKHAKEYGIDTGKIAVLGCSAGGQLAALLGTTNGNSIFADTLNRDSHFNSAAQAVVDIDGILAFKHPESAEGVSAAEWLGGTYETKAAVWEESSALNHVDSNTVQMLFINSSLPRFHAGRDDMMRKMLALGIYSEEHTIPDTPHPFWFFHPWFDKVILCTTVFLEKIFNYRGL